MKTETVGHTPRPWIARASEDVDAVEEWWVTADGYRVVVGAVGYCGPRTEANARLIAAAPDLLAAAKEAEDFISNLYAFTAEDPPEALKVLQEALAKAKGEES